MLTGLIWKLPLIAVIGYFLGNFQTGVIVSKLIGNFDVREEGSRSAGTTNVLRTMGWVPSVMTLVGDVLKGLLAAWLGLALGGVWGMRLGGLCAIIGHNWPALFHFKGGKGIATSLGVVLMINPLIGLCLVICQAVVLALTHTMSVASIASACLLSVLTLIFQHGDMWAVIFALVVTALALFSHRANLSRLIKRNENKLDFSKIKALTRRKSKEEEKHS